MAAKIQYVYDAGGNKLTMKMFAAGASTPNATTDYVGGFVYENTNLSFYTAPEGRVVMNKSYPEYQYGITDNQGNTRVLFTSATPQAETTKVDFEAATNSDVQNYPTGAYRNGMNLYDQRCRYYSYLRTASQRRRQWPGWHIQKL